MNTVRSDDDFTTFLEEMDDVTPLSKSDKIDLHVPAASLAQKLKRAAAQGDIAKQQNPLSMEGVKPVAPYDHLCFQQPGIQDGVFKNLRLGKYTVEDRISLKGLTLEQSRELVYTRLVSGHDKGMRVVLIGHGRGEQSQPFPALKKSYVNHWLREMEIVIAFHTAQPAHGGNGATYVLLKKHPQQKLINREKNRRR